jgi:uncharacterized protein (TIGR03083 family)
MEREQIFGAVAAERRRIADLIDALDEDALATPSLCAGWDVKTVAAHLVGVFADSFWTFLRAALRHGGFHRAIDELARRHARSPAAEIARTLRQCADHRLNPPVTGPLSGLTDVLVHGGDIQVPLGIAFRPDDDQVGWALDFLTGPRPFGFVPRGRLRGIALHSEPIGLATTNDADALIALKPDCIVYAASGPERDALAIPDYVRLLSAGINVVTTSTTRLVNPHSYEPVEWRDQLTAAAKVGQVSFYASGIEPGSPPIICRSFLPRSPPRSRRSTRTKSACTTTTQCPTSRSTGWASASPSTTSRG